MTNHEHLTAALLLFCVADYIKNSLESASRKEKIMTQKEEEAIYLRMNEIQNEINFLKANNFNLLNEIADYILKLEKEMEGLNHENN